ncbi:TetR/AcrR family transcriptional regulator [Actinoalloteichus spitiensis]|uniref:TetR/AcrR family transcriptional regulator n=1 Tax=Actinoalloteichus spitiensis TaxID=252394 RepID=UPI00036AF391|nr:TetR/AcrR family transcriptional regulator [Actinoalloteichus spitiensis]
MPEAASPSSRRPPRARYRELTLREIKDLAWEQVAEGGGAALSLNSIARRMGVTGPALYRYFANRDALLTDLVCEGYRGLAEAVDVAVPERGEAAPELRLRAFVQAMWTWSTEMPHRYLLLFGAPVPGYAAPEDTFEQAFRPMAVLFDVLAELPAGPAETSAVSGGRLRDQLAGWVADRGGAPVPPEVALRAVRCWTRLHGLISLALVGQFTATGVDPEAVLRVELDALLAGH